MLLLMVVVGFIAYQRGSLSDSNLQPGERYILKDQGPSDSKTSTETKTVELVDYELEIVAENLTVPWSLAFTSENRILVSQRPGTISIVEPEIDSTKTLLEITEVSPVAEAGLMGLVLDPDYETNKFFYACYAYDSDQGLRDKVVRIKDNGNSAEILDTLIQDIPAARFHAGCRLGIGPDSKLYITTGDATNKTIAQDLGSLGGKILRLNLDGSIPEDNPFENSPVYSYGHRNPQGISWHPVTGDLFETEHGPSGNDGPGGGDEVNLIRAGENYGWPLVSHTESAEGLVDPLLTFTPAEAPGSVLVYSGSIYPQFQNNLFFGALRGEGIVRIVLDEVDPTQIISYEKLSINVGRIRDVVQGPDGLIYFTTSNQDGRGDSRTGDDKIYKLTPTN